MSNWRVIDRVFSLSYFHVKVVINGELHILSRETTFDEIPIKEDNLSS
jgi:hypothetical protein